MLQYFFYTFLHLFTQLNTPRGGPRPKATRAVALVIAQEATADQSVRCFSVPPPAAPCGSTACFHLSAIRLCELIGSRYSPVVFATSIAPPKLISLDLSGSVAHPHMQSCGVGRPPQAISRPAAPLRPPFLL
jgi:hypothetical protein